MNRGEIGPNSDQELAESLTEIKKEMNCVRKHKIGNQDLRGIFPKTGGLMPHSGPQIESSLIKEEHGEAREGFKGLDTGGDASGVADESLEAFFEDLISELEVEGIDVAEMLESEHEQAREYIEVIKALRSHNSTQDVLSKF